MDFHGQYTSMTSLYDCPQPWLKLYYENIFFYARSHDLIFFNAWQHNVNVYTCWFEVDHQLQMSPEFEILTQIKACACLLICFFLKNRINTFQRLTHALLHTTLPS